jgi:hypothetical protein
VSLRNLLHGSLARRWMEEAVAELRQAFAPAAVPTAADGGLLMPGIGARLDLEQWERLKTRFFRL